MGGPFHRGQGGRVSQWLTLRQRKKSSTRASAPQSRAVGALATSSPMCTTWSLAAMYHISPKKSSGHHMEERKMNEPTANEQMYGWVQDLGFDLWLGAPQVFVPLARVVPTKNLLQMNVLLRMSKLDAKNFKDPILVVHSEGQFLLRDGHYRYTLAKMRNTNLLEVQLIETDDEVEMTGHVHPSPEPCREGCPKFDE